LGAIAISTSDDDLLEAVTSELSSLPPHRRAEDRSDLAGLVLTSNSVIHGDAEEAKTALATALQADPWNTEIRARLAELFLATGQSEEAANLLLMDMRETEGRLTTLRGMARLMNADEGGFGDVQRGVRARPWAGDAWEGLGWARGIRQAVGIEGDLDTAEDGQHKEDGA
jgi:superkiller protein 3